MQARDRDRGGEDLALAATPPGGDRVDPSAQIAIPFTLVALLFLAVLGSSIEVLVIILGLAGSEQYGRIVRAEVRKLMSMPFVEAERAAGASPWRIGVGHVLPNIVSPLVVQFTLAMSNIVLLESTLSFLGIGVHPPPRRSAPWWEQAATTCRPRPESSSFRH